MQMWQQAVHAIDGRALEHVEFVFSLGVSFHSSNKIITYLCSYGSFGSQLVKIMKSKEDWIFMLISDVHCV